MDSEIGTSAATGTRNGGRDGEQLRGPPWFYTRQIDDDPGLLEESYRLRYQVYCHERGFLDPNDYPEGKETDQFDPHSLHFGVFNLAHHLSGTVRLIQPSEVGMPLYDHCEVHPKDRSILDAAPAVAEVSRLAVSRDYRHRANDGPYGLAGVPTFAKESRQKMVRGERRTPDLPPVLYMYRAMYHASKRYGITHWLAATERSLNRLLLRLRFPFKEIGPAVDYFGPVTPYMLDLDHAERVLAKQCPVLFKKFTEGLPFDVQEEVLMKVSKDQGTARICRLFRQP